MLSHSTEYSTDGGSNWVLHTASEPVGPDKTITIIGLAPGTYNMRLRITPTTGGGPAVISDPFVMFIDAVMAGGVVAFATTSAELSVPKPLLGSLLGQSAMAAKFCMDMDATASGVAAVTGDAKLTALLAGSPQATSTATSTITAKIALNTATVAGAAIVSTPILQVHILFAGQVTSSAAVTGYVFQDLSMHSAVTAPAACSGAISTGIVLAASINAIQSPTVGVMSNVSVDSIPNTFSFTDVTNASLSTLYTSNTITISGINTPALVALSDGEYQVNGGAWLVTQTSVVNGDTIAVRYTSAATGSTLINIVLTVGGVSDTFSITTSAIPSTVVVGVTANDTAIMISKTSGGIGATSYDIHWGTIAGTRPNVVTGVTLPYSHTGLTNGTAYYYSIVAINEFGSAESSEVSATPATAPSIIGSFVLAGNSIITAADFGYNVLKESTPSAAGTQDTGYLPFMGPAASGTKTITFEVYVHAAMSTHTFGWGVKSGTSVSAGGAWIFNGGIANTSGGVNGFFHYATTGWTLVKPANFGTYPAITPNQWIKIVLGITQLGYSTVKVYNDIGTQLYTGTPLVLSTLAANTQLYFVTTSVGTTANQASFKLTSII